MYSFRAVDLQFYTLPAKTVDPFTCNKIFEYTYPKMVFDTCGIDLLVV